MTRSFAKTYGLRAKGKSKMAMNCGFNDEDEEEVAEMPHTKNLKEAARVDKITKEAWAKVVAHRKDSALTTAPETTTSPTPVPQNATAATPAPEAAATVAPAPTPTIR